MDVNSLNQDLEKLAERIAKLGGTIFVSDFHKRFRRRKETVKQFRAKMSLLVLAGYGKISKEGRQKEVFTLSQAYMQKINPTPAEPTESKCPMNQFDDAYLRRVVAKIAKRPNREISVRDLQRQELHTSVSKETKPLAEALVTAGYADLQERGRQDSIWVVLKPEKPKAVPNSKPVDLRDLAVSRILKLGEEIRLLAEKMDSPHDLSKQLLECVEEQQMWCQAIVQTEPRPLPIPSQNGHRSKVFGTG